MKIGTKKQSVRIPQPSSEKQIYTCKLLVSAAASVTSYDAEADIEYDILDEAVGHLPHYALIEASVDNGVSMAAKNGWKAERFESVCVTAEIWGRIEIALPFEPSGKLSVSQQRFIHSKAAEALEETIDSDYEPEVSDVEAWLTDDSGEPSLYLTGTLDVMEGHLSKRDLKRTTQMARQMIPQEVVASVQSAPDMTVK